mmetsp:Transcript_128096/g.358601  ORF Transcript_128096/g.358601 Transcript_128096/m.358601 type:complete len:306 (-) Transcript_128096:324-1241(-)
MLHLGAVARRVEPKASALPGSANGDALVIDGAECPVGPRARPRLESLPRLGDAPPSARRVDLCLLLRSLDVCVRGHLGDQRMTQHLRGQLLPILRPLDDHRFDLPSILDAPHARLAENEVALWEADADEALLGEDGLAGSQHSPQALTKLLRVARQVPVKLEGVHRGPRLQLRVVKGSVVEIVDVPASIPLATEDLREAVGSALLRVGHLVGPHCVDGLAGHADGAPGGVSEAGVDQHGPIRRVHDDDDVRRARHEALLLRHASHHEACAGPERTEQPSKGEVEVEADASSQAGHHPLHDASRSP